MTKHSYSHPSSTWGPRLGAKEKPVGHCVATVCALEGRDRQLHYAKFSAEDGKHDRGGLSNKEYWSVSLSRMVKVRASLSKGLRGVRE